MFNLEDMILRLVSEGALTPPLPGGSLLFNPRAR